MRDDTPSGGGACLGGGRDWRAARPSLPGTRRHWPRSTGGGRQPQTGGNKSRPPIGCCARGGAARRRRGGRHWRGGGGGRGARRGAAGRGLAAAAAGARPVGAPWCGRERSMGRRLLRALLCLLLVAGRGLLRVGGATAAHGESGSPGGAAAPPGRRSEAIGWGSGIAVGRRTGAAVPSRRGGPGPGNGRAAPCVTRTGGASARAAGLVNGMPPGAPLAAELQRPAGRNGSGAMLFRTPRLTGAAGPGSGVQPREWGPGQRHRAVASCGTPVPFSCPPPAGAARDPERAGTLSGRSSSARVSLHGALGVSGALTGSRAAAPPHGPGGR